jgi:hypothetical protein
MIPDQRPDQKLELKMADGQEEREEREKRRKQEEREDRTDRIDPHRDNDYESERPDSKSNTIEIAKLPLVIAPAPFAHAHQVRRQAA